MSSTAARSDSCDRPSACASGLISSMTTSTPCNPRNDSRCSGVAAPAKLSSKPVKVMSIAITTYRIVPPQLGNLFDAEGLLAPVARLGPSLMKVLTPYAAQSCCMTSSNCPADKLRSEEHTSELQSRLHLVCRLLLGKQHQLLCLASNQAALSWKAAAFIRAHHH